MWTRTVAALLALAALTACTSTARPAAAPPAAPAASAAAPVASPSASPTLSPSPSPSAPPRCTIFPADNIWHADVSRLPVLRDSARYVASIGAGAAVHADFGSGLYQGAPIGIPITTVPAGQPAVPVTFRYGSESDRGPYPIPRTARVEGGTAATGDRHVILYDPTRCRDYELYRAFPAGGSWRADSGAVFDLRGNRLRPAGWTSADAAGLPILAGLVRYSEVAAGQIDHAIRITVPRTRSAYVWPARHQASSATDAALPPMGLRLRLKASVSLAGLPAQARVVARAMQRYGVVIADNGSAWYLSGDADPHWNNDALHALGALRGSDFEAVDVSGLQVSANSAAVRGG